MMQNFKVFWKYGNRETDIQKIIYSKGLIINNNVFWKELYRLKAKCTLMSSDIFFSSLFDFRSQYWFLDIVEKRKTHYVKRLSKKRLISILFKTNCTVRKVKVRKYSLIFLVFPYFKQFSRYGLRNMNVKKHKSEVFEIYFKGLILIYF